MHKSESETDPSAPIRLGLIGVGGFARQTVNVLGDCPDVRVVSVADVNREAAEQAAHDFGANLFVDVRSLIVESPIDAVIMSLPHHEYPEYVRLVAQRGLHLLKEKPLGRSFEEAQALVEAFGRIQPARVFMIATQRRFAPGFAALKEHLPEIGRPFLVRSHFFFDWNGDFGWRGEKRRTGFGAFGDAGYHTIDLLNWLVGPPQEVYAMQSGGNRSKPLHPYDTDDTGLCMLRYAGGLMGYVACSWVTQPEVMDVVVHGTAGTLIATPQRLERLDLAGKTVAEVSVTAAEMTRQTMTAKIGAFVDAIRSGQKDYVCSARENLLNQAVIEAAYLSGRTGQPQLPARVFELHGLSMGDLLTPPKTKERAPAASAK